MWLVQHDISSFILSHHPRPFMLTRKLKRKLRKQTRCHHVIVECIFSHFFRKSGCLCFIFKILLTGKTDGVT